VHAVHVCIDLYNIYLVVLVSP